MTRRREDLSGTRVEAQSRSVLDVSVAGAPAGGPGSRWPTCSATPRPVASSRKPPPTEVGHVTELVTRTALAWPQVGFVLRHGVRTLVELPAVAEHCGACATGVRGASERGRC